MKVLLCMLYLHLIDDYKMQGWLASAKSKSWWQQNCPDKKYNKDYIIALIEHGFMNSFLIHIPIYIWLCRNELVLSFSILFFAFIHAIIDDLKANKKIINLIQDQIIHIILIIIWWEIFYLGGLK